MKISSVQSIKVIELISYWALVIFPCAIAFAPAFSSAAMVLLFICFVAGKTLRKEKFFSRNPVNTPFLAFLSVAVLSLVNSVSYADSVKGIYKMILNALLFLVLIEEIRDRKHVERIVASMVLGGCFAAFDAWWQVIFGWDLLRQHPPIINIGLTRATAAFPNANVLAIYLTPLIPVAAGLARYFYKGKTRLVYSFAVVLMVSGLLLTFSRGAALGCFLGLLVMALVRKDKLIVISLVLVLIASPFLLPSNIKNWAKTINYDPVIFMLNPDRVSIYRNTVNMISHHPFVGVGVNTFAKNYLRYKLPEPENAKTGFAVYAHNNFLHIAGEVGLLGLAAFIWFLISLFGAGIALYKRIKDAYFRLMVLILLVSLSAFLVNGLTETSLYYSRVAMLFWYLTGFLLAMRVFMDKEKHVSPNTSK